MKILFPPAASAYAGDTLQLRRSILFAALAAALAFADRAVAEEPFIVDAWSTADGLPQSSVIALTQSRDGYLWLGTLNGLVRFDGNAFTRFNVNNTPALPGDRIVFLFEDRRTNLWAGTDSGGLCAIQNGEVRNYSTGAGGGKILSAYEDETGAVWFCAADGRIFCARNGQLDLHPALPPLFWEQLFRRAFHLVVPQPNGRFWHLDPQTGHVEQWTSAAREKDLGAFPWPPALVAVPFPASKTGLAFDSAVTATTVDREGNLVVGTHGMGIYWLDAQGAWRHITAGEKSSRDFVLSVFFDREGNLWAGTDGGGLYRVRKNFLTTPPGLPTDVAQSAAEDAQGGLWVQDNSRGVIYASDSGTTNYGFGAWSLLVDAQQQVWAGTRGKGLFRFTAGNFQPVAGAEKIGAQIFALFQNHAGEIFAGGQNGFVSGDGERWKIYSAADGLPPNAVRAFAETAPGELWIGTDGGGIFRLQDGKVLSANAPVRDISCLLADREGTLWAGTSGHGLARLAAGNWTTFAARDGLGSDDIGYLLEDDAGNLWAGSYEGLWRVDKKSLAAFAADHSKKISSRMFLARECSAGAQPAAIRARDGRLLFPTIEGLVAVHSADLSPNTNPPPVVIESVLVDGVKWKTNALATGWNRLVTLTPDNEQLEIHFAGLNFSASKNAPAATRFKYCLEGRDKNWTELGGERVVRFPKLPAGNYFFHVLAGNEDGAWSPAGERFPVTIRPPFWREPGFVAAAILFLVGALAGTIYLISTAKLKRQLRAARQKELIETERARIARDLHDQLGANLTQVALLGEMAEADRDLPGEVEQHAQQICATARETTRSLDEIVWAVNPSNDTLEGLANYACKYAQDYFALAGVRFRAELPAVPPTPILPEVRHNVFLAFKEAVNNVVKHAQASEARVKLELTPERFILSITDNGGGVGDLAGKQLRNGLKNMRRRLADVAGEFDLAPGEKGGTVVRLVVPLRGK